MTVREEGSMRASGWEVIVAYGLDCAAAEEQHSSTPAPAAAG
jgi:hypothetical protein